MRKLIICIDRLHWLWLLLAAPFLIFPNPQRSLVMLVIPASWILHWALSQLKSENNKSTLSHPSPAPLPQTPLNSGLLLLAIMVLVSTWATYDVAFSLPKLSGVVLGFGAYFAIARESSNAKYWWISFLIFLGLGVGVAGLSLLGTNWETTKLDFLNNFSSQLPQLIDKLEGAKGGFHPNEVAGAILWILPVFVTLSFYFLLPTGAQNSGNNLLLKREKESKKIINPPILKTSFLPNRGVLWVQRILVSLSTLLVVGVFILTRSRSGFLALAITLPILLFLLLPRGGRWVFLVMILLIGIGLGLLLILSDDIPSFLNTRSGYSSFLDVDTLSLKSLAFRQDIWSRAIFALHDFSISGMGMNTFRVVVHEIYPLVREGSVKDFGHAHNEFLQAGLDLGIPGLIAFITLHIGTFWMLGNLWRWATRIKNREAGLIKAVISGFGGGLLAHMLYGLTDAVSLGAKPGLLFWILLGLIAGLHNQVSSNTQKFKPKKMKYPKLAI